MLGAAVRCRFKIRFLSEPAGKSNLAGAGRKSWLDSVSRHWSTRYFCRFLCEGISSPDWDSGSEFSQLISDEFHLIFIDDDDDPTYQRLYLFKLSWSSYYSTSSHSWSLRLEPHCCKTLSEPPYLDHNSYAPAAMLIFMAPRPLQVRRGFTIY